MRKRILCVVLIFVVVGMCCSCDSETVPASVSKTPVVAVQSYTDTFFAAEQYCSEKGYELVECATTEDAAVYVQNGKFDYVLIDSLSFIDPDDFELTFVETCSYKLGFSFCFAKENTVLLNNFNNAIASLKISGETDEIIENHKSGGYTETGDLSGVELRIICYPHFEKQLYYNSDGEVCGIEADIVKSICNELGYVPVFVPAEYDEMFSLLDEGVGDVVMTVDYSSRGSLSEYSLSDIYLEKTYDVYKRAEK